MPRIPLELIIEIFTWLPVMSLMRFRCVSKFFDSLVLDLNFIDVHHRRSGIRDGGTKYLMGKRENLYDIEVKERGKISRWNFDSHRCHHIGSCVNGLFCMWKWHEESVKIFNPSTRKVIQLPCRRNIPNLDNCRYYYSLAYEPLEKKYKVLMIVKSKGKGSGSGKGSSGSITSWIFTLNVDNESWREIKSTVDFFPHQTKKDCTIKGVVYMLDCLKKIIVAFDFRAENFRIIRLFDDIYDDITDYNLVQVKGKLAMLDGEECFNGKNDLWILENNSEKEEYWKSHSISFPLKWKSRENMLRPDGDCGNFENFGDDEIIFIAICDNIFECYFYDVGKSSWRYLEIPLPSEGRMYCVNFYVEGLYLC